MLSYLIRSFIVIGLAAAFVSCSTTVETPAPTTTSTTRTTTTTDHGYFR